jgi:hypothetical protein
MPLQDKRQVFLEFKKKQFRNNGEDHLCNWNECRFFLLDYRELSRKQLLLPVLKASLQPL